MSAFKGYRNPAFLDADKIVLFEKDHESVEMPNFAPHSSRPLHYVTDKRAYMNKSSCSCFAIKIIAMFILFFCVAFLTMIMIYLSEYLIEDLTDHHFKFDKIGAMNKRYPVGEEIENLSNFSAKLNNSIMENVTHLPTAPNVYPSETNKNETEQHTTEQFNVTSVTPIWITEPGKDNFFVPTTTNKSTLHEIITNDTLYSNESEEKVSTVFTSETVSVTKTVLPTSVFDRFRDRNVEPMSGELLTKLRKSMDTVKWSLDDAAKYCLSPNDRNSSSNNNNMSSNDANQSNGNDYILSNCRLNWTKIVGNMPDEIQTQLLSSSIFSNADHYANGSVTSVASKDFCFTASDVVTCFRPFNGNFTYVYREQLVDRELELEATNGGQFQAKYIFALTPQDYLIVFADKEFCVLNLYESVCKRFAELQKDAASIT